MNIDDLTDYRRQYWPAACFPADMPEADRYRYVLWHYIRLQRRQWGRERAALRPTFALRLAVRARWFRLALRTTCRLLRLMLVIDGSLPTRAAAARRRVR